MTLNNYIKINICLDVIEAELNKIAASTGHISFEEWLKENM